jgi:squalene synthase HpnC
LPLTHPIATAPAVAARSVSPSAPAAVLPIDHYENFPVASRALPARLRRPVSVIYRFARSADDIADEGDATDAERLAGIAAYRTELDRIAAGQTSEVPLFRALADTVERHALPLTPFYDLLDAFAQDVTVKRYADYASLADYCRRSANPVGTLMLHLYEAATPGNLQASDQICSALQLVNFWQDVAIDWRKERVYIPLDDLTRFKLTEQSIDQQEAGGDWSALMRFECDRARAMLMAGAPLAARLPGRIGFELAMIVHGGLRILDRIDRVEGDVFRHRPRLGPRDWPLVVWRGLRLKLRGDGA